MSEYCLVCANNEGVYLNINSRYCSQVRKVLEKYLSFKVEERKKFSNKICHKCVYEIIQCCTFLERIENFNIKDAKENQRKNMCSICQETSKSTHIFPLKENEMLDILKNFSKFYENNQLRISISKICLSCRYSSDVYVDLMKICNSSFLKLQNIFEGGIDSSSIPKTETLIVNRGNTLSRARRIIPLDPVSSNVSDKAMRSKRKQTEIDESSDTLPCSVLLTDVMTQPKKLSRKRKQIISYSDNNLSYNREGDQSNNHERRSNSVDQTDRVLRGREKSKDKILKINSGNFRSRKRSIKDDDSNSKDEIVASKRSRGVGRSNKKQLNNEESSNNESDKNNTVTNTLRRTTRKKGKLDAAPIMVIDLVDDDSSDYICSQCGIELENKIDKMTHELSHSKQMQIILEKVKLPNIENNELEVKDDNNIDNVIPECQTKNDDSQNMKEVLQRKEKLETCSENKSEKENIENEEITMKSNEKLKNIDNINEEVSVETVNANTTSIEISSVDQDKKCATDKDKENITQTPVNNEKLNIMHETTENVSSQPHHEQDAVEDTLSKLIVSVTNDINTLNEIKPIKNITSSSTEITELVEETGRAFLESLSQDNDDDKNDHISNSRISESETNKDSVESEVDLKLVDDEVEDLPMTTSVDSKITFESTEAENTSKKDIEDVNNVQHTENSHTETLSEADKEDKSTEKKNSLSKEENLMSETIDLSEKEDNLPEKNSNSSEVEDNLTEKKIISLDEEDNSTGKKNNSLEVEDNSLEEENNLTQKDIETSNHENNSIDKENKSTNKDNSTDKEDNSTDNKL